MTLTRWSPVSSLAALEIDRLNKMFDAAFNGEPLAHGAWVPPVDIYEDTDHAVVVKVEVSDIKKEDIKVGFEDNVLTIEGERKFAEDRKREDYHRVERGYGAFRRSFTMPATVDGTRIQAGYQDGVLTVTLPQRPEARPRQIPVNG